MGENTAVPSATAVTEARPTEMAGGYVRHTLTCGFNPVPHEIVDDNVGDQNGDGLVDRVGRTYSYLYAASLSTLEEGRYAHLQEVAKGFPTINFEHRDACVVESFENNKYRCGIDFVEYQRKDGTFSLADPTKQTVTKWNQAGAPIKASFMLAYSVGDRWVNGTNLHDAKYKEMRVPGMDPELVHNSYARADSYSADSYEKDSVIISVAPDITSAFWLYRE